MTADPSPSEPYSLTVDVDIQDPAWTEAVPSAVALAEEVIRETLANKAVWCHWPEAAPTGALEVSVCFAGNEFVQGLNQKFRGKNTATNVLSFPAGDRPGNRIGTEPVMLGDIVLAQGVVLAEARRDGKTPRAHTSHLLIHGALHLLGFSHNLDPEAEAMEALEVEILEVLGIANPYLETSGQKQTPKRQTQ